MIKRFANCVIQSPIDDIWDKTLTFWEYNWKKNVKVEKIYVSENHFYREVIVKHGLSVHPYGTSSGEIYKMKFAYLPSERITYVNIEIDYSWAGRGFVWMVPNNIMKSWASQMGIQPIKLLPKQDKSDLAKFNQISNNCKQLLSGNNVNFCPICGNQLSIHSKFCIECGANLQEI